MLHPDRSLGAVRSPRVHDEARTVTGNWDDVRLEERAATLRFQGTMLLDGEPRIQWTLRYANGAWSPPIKAYSALHGKLPDARPPYGSFATRARTTLRAAPAVDDAPPPASGTPAGQTTTLRGNVLAAYPPGARGVVLAGEGAWRYVAFDPASAPIEPLVKEPVGAPDAGPEGAWHCGWVAASEIAERR